MAYVSKEMTKKIREELKNEFPSIKFSVRKLHNITLCVDIMSSTGEIDFTKDVKERGFKEINHYHIEGRYENEEILQKIVNACHKEYYCNDDSQRDYYDSAYFFQLRIGKYNKPYEYKGA